MDISRTKERSRRRRRKKRSKGGCLTTKKTWQILQIR
jgi:hypothetical protein